MRLISNYMEELIKRGNDVVTYKSKEWPFANYSSEIKNLREYFNREVEIHTLGHSGVNRQKIIPMGLFDINSSYLNPEDKDSLYPHSLIYSNGSAINMNQVIFINLESKTEEFWLKLCPFTFALSPNKDNLKLFNSPNMIYKNVGLFKDKVYHSRKAQMEITKMTQEAFDMGMFD